MAPLDLLYCSGATAILSAPDAQTADYAQRRLDDALKRALGAERIVVEMMGRERTS